MNRGMSDKPEQQISRYGRTLRDTFMTSYLVMFGYTCITLVEALRTSSTQVRHIMNIETAVSLVAGIVYGMFIERAKQPNFDLKDIMPLRYLDWIVTTPLIILGIVLFYTGKGQPVNWRLYAGLVGLDWAMLAAGYAGELGYTDRWLGLGLGFVAFGALLWLLWTTVVGFGRPMDVFWIFAVIWSFYGVAYMLEEETKNIAYNILDVISKALFGVALWMYFGRVLAFGG